MRPSLSNEMALRLRKKPKAWFTLQRPRERRPQVVVLGLQLFEPLKLLGSPEFRLGLLRQPQVVLGVRAPHGLRFAALFEPLCGVLPYGLQHAEVGPFFGFLLLAAQQPFGEEQLHTVQYVEPQPAVWVAHLFCRGLPGLPDAI